nr:InlB B-repeat-containing protein [Bifidobacterium sp. W8110]
MDGQALTLSRKDRSWQTEIPARKPGPAAITLAGRQDGQPFTRSLNYTVDQTLTRDTQQSTTYKVTFNADGGNPEPADQNFSTPNSRVKRPSPDPTREGYQFDGWFTGNIAYDFSRPVTENLTLTAKWTFQDPNNTWSISPDKGSQLGNESTIITPPDITRRNIRFSQVSGSKNDSSTTYGFSLAVGSDGNAYAWGDNRYGQLGDGTTTQQNTPVQVKKPAGVSADFTYVQVSAGSYYSLALGSDGYVYAWGYNHYGQLGNKTKSDSSKPIRVRDPANPEDANKGLQATQVSAGYSHSLAVGNDGYAYAWGFDYCGQLGNNSTTDSTVPVHVRDPANPDDESKGLQATQVDGGYEHSLALGSDGYAYAWGENDKGQLGNNTTSGYYYPVKVLASEQSTSKAGPWLHAVRIIAGDQHSLAIDTDGNTKAWGRNDSGRLGDGTTNNKSAPVPVVFNLQLVITGVRFDQTPVSGLTNGDGGSVTVLTPEHLPGTVTVSVDYTLVGAAQKPDTSLRYTYLPAGTLPEAGGEGILLTLAAGTMGIGGVLASSRHRREQHQLLHASHE